jgi:CheY-like chemotaxis protein
MIPSADPPPRVRIRKLLLAGNPYDAFLLEEAGFRPPGQDDPADAPAFDLVTTGATAFRVLASGDYDMLLTGHSLPDMSGQDLVRRVKGEHPSLPVAVVTSNTELGGASEGGRGSEGGNLFIWYGADSFLWGLIRLFEDEMNAPLFVSSGNALVILLVEDEPNFYSHFIPLLHERVRASAVELTPEERRPSSIWDVVDRPLVLLRRNFEDSCEVLYRYKTQVLAVITDMCFPVKGELKTDAGLRLLYRARAINAHMPVAVHSHEREHQGAAQEARAKFLWKDSPHLLSELDQFLVDFCGFGPFVFRWPAGEVYGVAHNLQELRRHLADVPEVVFEHHALHFDFSTWLAVHGHQHLAHLVRSQSITDPAARQLLLDVLDGKVEESAGTESQDE